MVTILLIEITTNSLRNLYIYVKLERFSCILLISFDLERPVYQGFIGSEILYQLFPLKNHILWFYLY